LQRRPALGVAGVREAVGVNARLDLAVGALERLAVERKGRGQPEQLEVARRR
jgi:hypothetical protein